LPYAGGGVSLFRTWPDILPEAVEVCAVRLPGRETRFSEPPYVRLKPLVQALADVIVPQLNSQFAFFGHSMGALIGFELTRELRRRHCRLPTQLYVSAYPAPQVPASDPPIHFLPDDDFLAELRQLNDALDETLQHAELRPLLLLTLRADYAVCETYSYEVEPPLNCSIVTFGGLQDDGVTREELESWREQTSQAFSLRMVPGDHFFIHRNQSLFLRTLAYDLIQQLQQVG
jgi:medium-chain acyl-[acyl-carrier-protein] hydrolase